MVAVSGCAASSGTVKQSTERIEMQTYSILPPPGKDWQIKVDEENEKVICLKRYQNLLALIKPNFFKEAKIEVFRNEVGQGLWDLNQDEIAQDFLQNEEKIMREKGEAEGIFKIKKLEKGTMEIGDKKVYKMYWKNRYGGTWDPYYVSEATIFLYFPPDFDISHQFFMILISDLRNNDLYKHDPDPAHAVINSMIVK
jgi:hypothetical protein